VILLWSGAHSITEANTAPHALFRSAAVQWHASISADDGVKRHLTDSRRVGTRTLLLICNPRIIRVGCTAAVLAQTLNSTPSCTRYGACCCAYRSVHRVQHFQIHWTQTAGTVLQRFNMGNGDAWYFVDDVWGYAPHTPRTREYENLNAPGECAKRLPRAIYRTACNSCHEGDAWRAHDPHVDRNSSITEPDSFTSDCRTAHHFDIACISSLQWSSNICYPSSNFCRL
jgi:hypothetical protein